MNDKATAFARIFAVSFLVLFCEIMAMRWLGMEIRVLKAFPNLIVIISLIATSSGLLHPQVAPGSNKIRSWQILAAFIFVFVCVVFSLPLHFFDLSIKSDHPTSEIALATGLLLSLTGCLYVLFRRLGQLLGAEFGKLKPIVAYSSNLLGSIAGVFTFMLISWLCVPPYAWLVVLGGVLFALYRHKSLIAVTVCCAVVTAVCYSAHSFSPYSKIILLPVSPDVQEMIGKDSFILYSNNLLFNSGVNIDKADRGNELSGDTKEKQSIKNYFEFLEVPIALAPVHDDVLVLGEGSGNDVAFALKMGAKHVDGVEIDPIIAQVGKNRHPNRPLADPRARIFNEDARTFLRYHKEKYDLVEFAFLDTGNTVDSASLVRVDNFVYTLESMKSVLNHLKPNGVATVVFTCPSAESFIYQRLYQTVADATGTKPIAYLNKQGSSICIVFGPGAKAAPPSIAARLVPYPPADLKLTEKSVTDNWPFLYLFVEPAGLLFYSLILLIAVVMPAVLLVVGKSEGEISKPDWGVMFFLGQGFMLVETKSITQLSLLFGATWLVSSVVILFVLIFAYCANMIAASREFKSVGPLYLGLAAALLLGYFWEIPAAGTEHPMLGALLMTTVACLPVLFGSLIFSICFKRATSNTAYLSANLIGVAIGGLTENICMFNGIKSLSLVALIIYGLSYICWKVGNKGRSSADQNTEKDVAVSPNDQ
jgi:spermidine synthase